MERFCKLVDMKLLDPTLAALKYVVVIWVRPRVPFGVLSKGCRTTLGT